MKSVLAKALALGFSMLVSAPSLSAQQWCSGSITAAWVHANGELYVLPSWRGDHIRLCSTTAMISAGGQSVEPTVCLGWLSTIRLAMANNKQTIIYYPDAPVCSAIPTYSGAPAPVYVMVLST